MLDGLENMSPEDVAEAMAALKERDRQLNSEKRAEEDMDRILRRRLQDNGVAVGDPWQDPDGKPTRAYPCRWVVQHAGHWWQAVVPFATEEPALSSTHWALNDPTQDTEPGTDPDAWVAVQDGDTA